MNKLRVAIILTAAFPSIAAAQFFDFYSITPPADGVYQNASGFYGNWQSVSTGGYATFLDTTLAPASISLTATFDTHNLLVRSPVAAAGQFSFDYEKTVNYGVVIAAYTIDGGATIVGLPGLSGSVSVMVPGDAMIGFKVLTGTGNNQITLKITNFSAPGAAVPEPAETAAMVALGLGAFAWVRRNRKTAAC